MRSEALQKIIGRPVKDVYGRHAGFVIGFSVGADGELQTLGVDQGSGIFSECPSSRVIWDTEGMVVIPEWKAEIEGLQKETELIRKRALALSDLSKEGEIPQNIYQEMHAQSDNQLGILQESQRTFGKKMQARIDELVSQAGTLDRFLVNLKIQFRSGEIDEGTFRVAADRCNSMKAQDIQERDDITRVLSSMRGPLDMPISSESANRREAITVEGQTRQEG